MKKLWSLIKWIIYLCYRIIRGILRFIVLFLLLLLNPFRLARAVRSSKERFMSLNHASPIGVARPMAHWMLWSTFLCIIIFLFWAKFANIEEVTVAPATVIPSGHVQSIQNMEGGIIKKIYVHEGELVEKDQIVLEMDPTRFISALNEAKMRAFALEVKIARLSAEIANKPFQVHVNKELRDTYNGLLESSLELYQSRQNQLNELKKNLAISKQELTMTEPLVAAGAASPVEVLHLQRQVVDIQNQIADFYSHSLDALETAKDDYITVRASLLALQDRLNRTIMRSPVKGAIKQIRIASKEGVEPPGNEIMSIVPIEDKLLVEAKVKPADIGFIHPGQTVTVKITAYDYTIYGGLSGSVDQISADTITDEKGHSYYLVRIKTPKNYLRSAKNPLYIIPGMTASVDILTGRRTILNYLISPLLKAQASALRER